MSVYRTNDFEFLDPVLLVNSANVLAYESMVDIPPGHPDGTLVFVMSSGLYYIFNASEDRWCQTVVETKEYWYIHLENELFAAIDERNVSPFVITPRRNEAYRFSSIADAYRAVERIRSLSGNSNWAVLSSRA